LKRDTLQRHQHILELGSGTGAVGIYVAHLLSRSDQPKLVTVTDMEDMMGVLRANVEMARPPSGTVKVEAINLHWGEPLATSIIAHPPTLLLLADCVYYEPAFPLLVQTLQDLINLHSHPEDIDILFCYKKRRKADKKFFKLAQKVLSWSEVDDDPFREQYKRDSLYLYRMIKKGSK